jgi:hypothetical protein
VTAQHRGLLDQTLQAFAIAPDYDLDVMRPGQTLAESTSRIVAALDPVLAKEAPDLVMVQGDTTTAFCGALGAFYRDVPVAHVEAGLRSGDFRQPFPEEMNRVLVTRQRPRICCAKAWRRTGFWLLETPASTRCSKLAMPLPRADCGPRGLRQSMTARS